MRIHAASFRVLLCALLIGIVADVREIEHDRRMTSEGRQSELPESLRLTDRPAS